MGPVFVLRIDHKEAPRDYVQVKHVVLPSKSSDTYHTDLDMLRRYGSVSPIDHFEWKRKRAGEARRKKEDCSKKENLLFKPTFEKLHNICGCLLLIRAIKFQRQFQPWFCCKSHYTNDTLSINAKSVSNNGEGALIAGSFADDYGSWTTIQAGIIVYGYCLDNHGSRDGIKVTA